MGAFEETLSATFLEATKAALSKKVDESLAALSRAERAGVWWPRAWIDHPDLALIRPDPRFQRIAEEFDRRREAAEASASPQLHTLKGREGVGDTTWLFALHGANDRGEDFLRIWRPALDLGISVAVPQSSQVFSPAGFSWHDRDKAMREITSHLSRLTDKPILAGFSQGAALAIHAVAQREVLADGVIAVCPAGLYADAALKALKERRFPVPLVIVTGDRDHGREQAVALAAEVIAQGVPCQLDDFAGMAHGFPADFASLLPKYLQVVTREVG